MTTRTVTFIRRPLTIAVALAVLGISDATLADLTKLADIPLANASTTDVLPNIAIVIDDSGSMDEENLPDSEGKKANLYCFKWYKYNRLAYNPNLTYTAPIKADGTRFPDASFTAALKDGYFTSSQKMYDGTTDNGVVDLTKLVTASGSNTTSVNVWMPDFGSTSKGTYERATSVTVKLLDNSNLELMATTPAPATGSNNEDDVGQAIADAINANTGVTGFTADYFPADSKPSTGVFSGTQFFGKLVITAPASQYGLATKPTVTLVKTSGTGTLKSMSAESFVSTTTTYKGSYYTAANDTTSTVCDTNSAYTPVVTTGNIAAPKVSAGSAAALTNYANWYSYYRKRSFLMKAAVGEAFAGLDKGKYRVGYFTIDSLESDVDPTNGKPVNHDLAIDTFDGSHRDTWFERLYGTRMALYTPLRGALSRMGRMYAGQIKGFDPVQYSCQRNFTILTTDGYWNTDAEVSETYGPYEIDNKTEVGDQDGSATAPSLDANKKSNTLADIAYYYYHTDLRTSDLSNCKWTDGVTTRDLCENNVPSGGSNTDEDDVATHQHMTTFTLGLGVDGTLAYRSDYKTALTKGNTYYDILQGTVKWPDPIKNTGGERIDDLWHAAVNGRGQYFSARDPESLTSSLVGALQAIDTIKGSGAAAATGSLQPTAGDPGSNMIYIASYQTNDWYGDVAAHQFSLSDGTVNTTPEWTADELLDARITSSGSVDTRTIYVSVAGARKSFSYDNLDSTQKGYFDNSKLSQYAGWTTDQKSAASGQTLVNYLRGQYNYEDQDGNTTRIYRDRKHVLGDIVHSQPVYVKKSPNQFDASHDPTHGNRMGMLYVASNDGMLHAFCTETSGSCSPGKELWAFVVPPAMKNMWYLADKKFGANHHFMVDGPMAVADAYIKGGWKTILVGGLGKGGRGYYAFDITDPTNPSLLWSFTADDDQNMGFSYGTPIVTKVDSNGDGVGDNTEWRVLLPSGYNNVKDPDTGEYPNGDGAGHLFVVDAETGKSEFDIATSNSGDAPPSGLAHIQALVPNFDTDNTATAAFGGDLFGDMWRFDLANKKSAKVIGLTSGRPITTAPEIGDIDGTKALYFGTGVYLDETDLAGTLTLKQVIVAVRADATDLTIADLTEQDGTKTIDWTKGYGWYRVLDGEKERVHLSPQLFLGTLMFATVLPTASDCNPGGTSRLYFVNYKNGKQIGTSNLYETYQAPLVGLSAVFLGEPKVFGITAKGDTPTPKSFPIDTGLFNKDSDSGKRIMWRELID